MEESVTQFAGILQPHDVALFFYSGHGSQVEGQNYLIPVNERIESEADCKYKAVNANWILDKIERARINIVILDACRDNPYRGVRSGNKGMAPMTAKPGGTYIVFATAAGETASNGSRGRNSPFTASLIKNIKIQNIKIEDVIKRITREVMQNTGNHQVPWVSGNLIDDFYFNYNSKKPLIGQNYKVDLNNKIDSYENLYIIKDIDGNIYKTIRIGNQVWMVENLKVTHYRNGDPIPNITNSSEWNQLNKGAYCTYYNDPENAIKFGCLYNWYAINDSRSIAPEGWHVPSDEEWKELEIYLGMQKKESNNTGWRGINIGGELKDFSSSLWKDPNTGANNYSGFSALPGGYRTYSGSFKYIGRTAYFCSYKEEETNFTWIRCLNFRDEDILRYVHDNKHDGFSVRCIKD